MVTLQDIRDLIVACPPNGTSDVAHRRKREKLDWVIADDASRSAVGHPWSRALRLVLDGPTLLLKSEQRGYQDVARGRHSFPRF